MKLLYSSIAALLLLSSCAEPKTFSLPDTRPATERAQPLASASTKTFPTYGLIDADSKKSQLVCYEVSGWSIFWSVILVETVIVPIYELGFDLYQPVRLKNDPTDSCGIDSK